MAHGAHPRQARLASTCDGRLLANWRNAGATHDPGRARRRRAGSAGGADRLRRLRLGIGGPFPDGHYASTSVIGTAAYNSYRWKTLLPIEVYVDHAPTPSLYYMHHPLGMFWVIDVLGKVFGLHDWVLRLPPLVYVTVTTALLYKLGRALWGAIPGGLCALAYVALPITLGYANYHDLEQPVIFGVRAGELGLPALRPHLARALRGRQRAGVRLRAQQRLGRLPLGRAVSGRACSSTASLLSEPRRGPLRDEAVRALLGAHVRRRRVQRGRRARPSSSDSGRISDVLRRTCSARRAPRHPAQDRCWRRAATGSS